MKGRKEAPARAQFLCLYTGQCEDSWDLIGEAREAAQGQGTEVDVYWVGETCLNSAIRREPGNHTGTLQGKMLKKLSLGADPSKSLALGTLLGILGGRGLAQISPLSYMNILNDRRICQKPLKAK